MLYIYFIFCYTTNIGNYFLNIKTPMNNKVQFCEQQTQKTLTTKELNKTLFFPLKMILDYITKKNLRFNQFEIHSPRKIGEQRTASSE